jgi:signal transduction histidine kinase
MVEITVEDTGKGISEESLTHVFDRFWQEKNTAYIGTGLGLAISKGLVEAQGGKMWVKSLHGSGTTFYFTLKLAVTEN